MMSNNETIDQQECKYALECVERILRNPIRTNIEEYYRFARRMPPMIITCGLGQSIAFLLSQCGGTNNDDGKKQLFDDISMWLSDKQKIYSSERMILFPMMEEGLDTYLHAQEMTLRLLFWIRKILGAYVEENVQ